MNTNTYEIAKEQYAAIGIDTEAALNRLDNIPVVQDALLCGNIVKAVIKCYCMDGLYKVIDCKC